MGKLKLKTNSEVEEVFANYPEHIREKLQFLRELVIETAAETEGFYELEESLKWGEPSFVTKNGSNFRMDSKPKTPDQYALIFSMFEPVCGKLSVGIVLPFSIKRKPSDCISIKPKHSCDGIKKCIQATFTYHEVKHLENLGM